MFYAVGPALEIIFSSRYGWLVIPLFVGVVVFMGLTAQDEVDKIGDQNRAARNLWLSECSEPINVCAAAWDDGWTLRQLYVERVPIQR